MRKRKSSIIPLGDFEKVKQHDQEEFAQAQEKEFFENPLIPWWVKVAYVVCPVPLHKPDRAATWCKYCRRKHSKRERCEVLRLEEDLTRPPTKVDKDGNLIPNRKVGYYATRPKEALAA